MGDVRDAFPRGNLTAMYIRDVKGIVMGQIIGTIIFGAVIGILARLVLPGKQQYGMIVTVVLGVAGALIGYWVWGAISDEGDTGGIDWIRWIISIAAAAVFSIGYSAVTGKK